MNKQILILMTTFSVLSAQSQIKYPQTPRDNTVDEYFGVKVADPYRWLENDTSAATAQWVVAENEVTNAYLARIPFRGKLLKRLKEVANYEKVGTPFKKHGRWYLYKNNGLQNQSVLYTMDRLDGEQRVFLDPNKLIREDIEHPEELRYDILGKVGKVLFVVCAFREQNSVRLISARIATGPEKARYE